jgi:hypothetical protein
MLQLQLSATVAVMCQVGSAARGGVDANATEQTHSAINLRIMVAKFYTLLHGQ